MNSNRKTAIIVGILFIINLVANTIGSSIMESIMYAPDYLSKLYANQTLVIIAEFLELICAVAIIGIVVKMFPILKEQDEKIARRFFAFRTIEVVMMVVGIIIALSLLPLSQEYVKAGAPDDDYFQTRGNLALAGRYWAFKMVLIFCLLGYLMFFYLTYQSKLIPRFISVWGLIIVPLMFTAIMLEIFVSDSFSYTTMFPGFLIFYLPGAPLDLVLGIWLIVKGFNDDEIASGSAKTDLNE